MTVYRRGKTWFFDFWLDGIRHQKRVGPSKRAAKEAERQERQRAYQVRYHREWDLRPARATVPLVKAFLQETYLPSIRQTVAPGTYRNAQSVARKILEAFGHLRLSDVTPEVIERYRDWRLGAGCGPNGIRKDWEVLRGLFALATEKGYASGSPAARIKLPRLPAPPDRILTDQEERRLLRSFTSQVVADMIRLILWTGLRRQEVCGLRRGDVDVAGRRLTVRQPKTGVVKLIPLLPEAVELLRHHLRPAQGTEDPVFRNRLGRAFHPITLWDAYDKARTRAQLQDVRLHDLRHTVATRLLRAGVDLPTVGLILGHRPPYRTTLRYVAHVDETRARKAMQALQKSLRRL